MDWLQPEMHVVRDETVPRGMSIQTAIEMKHLEGIFCMKQAENSLCFPSIQETPCSHIYFEKLL